MSQAAAAAGLPKSKGNSLRDERGAIMVMGVFLSCSLIAGMWYMMGIGDAILWRDRSQEAADAIAFTSAAVHARGMNFISAVNIMMLIIVSIYLVMCIARSVLDILLYITGDPWKSTCNPLSSLGVPPHMKDTTGHGLFSFIGAGVPGLADLSGFGMQEIKFILGGAPPRYRRSDWHGLWGPISDVDAWGTGAGLRDYVVNIKKCGGCVASIVSAVGEVIASPESVGVTLLGLIPSLAAGLTTCITCVIACKRNHPFEKAAEPIAGVYHKLEGTILPTYEKFMNFTLPKMHDAEKGAAKIMPWVGFVAGAWAGYQYTERMTYDPNKKVHHLGIPLSPSMFPDLDDKGQQKELKPSCADTNGQQPCLDYIKYKGNGCGPTMCADGQHVSHSGGYKPCTKSDPKECDGQSSTGKTDIECCDAWDGTDPQCTFGTGAAKVCGPYGGPGSKAQQDLLYQTKPYPKNHRYGLPVEAQDMNELCFKAGSYLGEFLGGLFTQIPGISQALALSNKLGQVVSKVPGLGGLGNLLQDPIGTIANAMGEKMKQAYCVGDEDVQKDLSKFGPSEGGRHISDPDDYKVILKQPFWYNENPDEEKGGPMKVVDYAKNGNDWFQVYGLVFPQYYNLSTHEYGNDKTGNWAKLRLAVGPKEAGKSQYDDNATNMDRMIFYVSEAEFYADCDAKWDDTACNGNDHTMYRLNWRTRLRRVHKPKWLSDAIAKVPGIKDFQKVTGLIVKNEADIAYVVDTITGVNIQGPLDVIDYINGLAAPGQNLPEMVH